MKKDQVNGKIPLPDLRYIKQMIGDNDEALNEIFLIFIEEAPVTLKNLRESAEKRDHDSLKSIAHSFSTELTMLGINSIVEDMKAINRNSEEMKNLDDVIDKIVRTVVFSVEFFKTLI